MLTAHQTGEAGPRLIVVLISHRESMGGPPPPSAPLPSFGMCGSSVGGRLGEEVGCHAVGGHTRCSNKMNSLQEDTWVNTKNPLCDQKKATATIIKLS